EEDDALDQPVGVVHLLDRFHALLLRQLGVAPVLGEAVVQPVLIDRGELVAQGAVEDLDDLRVPSHGLSVSLLSAAAAAPARSSPSTSETTVGRHPPQRGLRPSARNAAPGVTIAIPLARSSSAARRNSRSLMTLHKQTIMMPAHAVGPRHARNPL